MCQSCYVSPYLFQSRALGILIARGQICAPLQRSPSALRYPSLTLQFFNLICSRYPASARSTFSFGGRFFLTSSKVVRGWSAKAATASQSAGRLIETTQEVASSFLYGQQHQPMRLRSSSSRNEAIHSSLFSPDSPIQTGTSYFCEKSTYSCTASCFTSIQYL